MMDTDMYLAEPLAEVVGKANRAASLAERASAILAENGNRAGEPLAERALKLAGVVARAHKAEIDDLAELAAADCERIASEVVAFDKARLSDLDAEQVWTEPGLDALEADITASEVMCADDPSKRASQGRYMKGCRCEPCKEARRAKQRAARAAK